MRDKTSALILNHLRNAKQDNVPLKEVVKASNVGSSNGEIPDHTGGGIFGGSLNRLITNGLVRLFEEEKDISDEIPHKNYSVEIDYTVVRFLEEKGEGNLSLTLTDSFERLQSAIGFSITDIVSKDPGAITVSPFFGLPRAGQKSDVFVLMPFRDDLKPIYEDHIKAACTTLKLTCQRADDFFNVGHIMSDVWSAIYYAQWIVADCTGRNPNVFYELGIAHTLGKRVILITQREDDVPFDIRHLRYFRYDYTPRGMKKLEESLVMAISGPDRWAVY